MKSETYTFSGFTLDVGERLLFDGERPITLPPKVFDTLVMFAANPGKVLSKERMMTEIWEDSFVEENNLAQNISQLRRVLGSEMIETVPKFGYRFIADVGRGDVVVEEVIGATTGRIYIDDGSGNELHTTASQLSALSPRTQYVQNGEVNIAYQVVGNGPIDIVFVMGWVSHLEYFWRHHTFASFLEKLSSFSRLILFDKRGTGLSDRVPLDKLPTLEQRMEDVHAVMDAVGSERAVLVGVSEGGPMCSLFAATYPERTAGLVMIGTYAKRIRDDDYPWAPTEEQREAFFDLMRREWGGPVGIDERAPSMKDDAEFRNWWAEYLRNGASPGAAVALTQMNAEIDVRGVLPSVRVPTLVIHRSGDICLKVEEGRFVADQIPDSTFVELGGIDHLPFVGDSSEIVDEIEEFVASVGIDNEYDRVLATVICIELADPSSEEEKHKDDWNEFTERSKSYVHKQLRLFKGKVVSVGDERTLAAFDGPARAIRCASAINQASARAGIALKIGIHTGECDVRGDVYSGFAVDLATKIAELSTDGNILVSRTVKDLVAGSGLKFNEVGIQEFENIDGQWRLFEVAP
ncbi:MAG TPA: alpha/beta fold hydrolase [Pyrinomonadaceae bacterium]|nr:alpha/beta fold hydrolase [Pyrinomonadaceae bacterium]